MKNQTKGIELTLEVTEYLKKKGFDTFEVHPCKVVSEDKSLPVKQQCVEQCDEKDAEFWSVYVHLVDGGLDCIADCETKEMANKLVEFLKVLCQNYDPSANYHM